MTDRKWVAIRRQKGTFSRKGWRVPNPGECPGDAKSFRAWSASKYAWGTIREKAIGYVAVLKHSQGGLTFDIGRSRLFRSRQAAETEGQRMLEEVIS